MSGNTFGKIFTVTTFGESHGVALGCIVDGCPPGMTLSEKDIQVDLDRRSPGKSEHTTKRNEPDTVEILSGIFEGKLLAHQSDLLLEIKIKNQKTIAPLKINLDRVMPIIPISKNTELETIEAEEDLQLERQQ